MSRVKKFAASLATGYLAMGVNVAYTMASIPLALHYLGKEEFGLWALAQQISGYLLLLDFGMASALSRFLADHKDDAAGDQYGSLFLTGSLVFLVQGLVIGGVGVGLSLMAPALFAVPMELRHDFTVVLTVLSVVAGLSVMLRSVGAPLWAFQRLDVVNLCAALSLLLAFAWLWWAFDRGWGIYSLAAAGIPGLVVSSVIVWGVCRRNGFYPGPGRWGRPRWDFFQKIFGFGKDVLLMSLGSQLVNASQIMVISRMLGLEAAATFAVATKFYTLGQQFVSKILEGAAPTLTEMFVHKEMERFRQRFREVVLLTLAMAVMGGACLAWGNRILIGLWTSGAVTWSWQGDGCLALLILLTSLSRCYVGIFGIAGNLRSVRYLYLCEGILFVLLAVLGARYVGILGVLMAALAAHLMVTTWRSMRHAQKYLGEFHFLLRPLAVALGVLAGVVGMAGWMQQVGTAPWILLFSLPLLAFLSSLLAWHCLLPYGLRSDLRGRLQRWIPRKQAGSKGQ